MDWRRWTWRFVVALPAVALVGLLGPRVASADGARAADPVPCPSPSSLPLPVIGTACQTVQQATSTGSAGTQQVVQNLNNAVTNATGSPSSSQTGSGGTSATGGSAGSASAAHRSLSGASADSSAAAGIAPAILAALSPLGIPGLLLTSDAGALSPSPAAPVQLNFPVANSARRTAIQHSGTAPPRVWLVFLVGAVGLVGAAGAGGHFLGGPRLRFRGRNTTEPH